MIGRSVVFGMAVALLFFPADNVLLNIWEAVGHVTNNTAWFAVTAYQLGPTLNALPASLLLGQRAGNPTVPPVISDGAQPLVFYDGTHALVVVLVYILVCAAISFTLFQRRDVQE